MLKKSILASCLIIIVVATSCNHKQAWVNSAFPSQPVPDQPGYEFIQSVFLIGDAGEPDLSSQEGTFQLLQREVGVNSDRNTIVFLGDNIYPGGLTDSSHSNYVLYKKRLLEQVNIGRTSGAKSIFISGNHDWGKYGDENWPRLNNEVKFINAQGDSNLLMLPENGCSGPQYTDIGARLRLITLNSQWFLQDWSEAEHPNGCPIVDLNMVTEQLAGQIQSAQGRIVLIAAHHPLRTHGQHGGFFSWKTHLFPLTAVSEYLWIPLPVFGSIYPLYRWLGFVRQDTPNATYRSYIETIEKALENSSPVLIASGHDHALQVIFENKFLQIVSGAGTQSVVGQVSDGENTVFAHAHTGFVRLDFTRNKKVLVRIFEPGNSQAVYSRFFSEFSGE